MEDRIAEVTVSVVLPDMLPFVAVMVVGPGFKAVAKPPLFTVATEGFEEVQATCVDTSILVPLAWVSVAVNCCVPPMGILGFAGVISTREFVAGGWKGKPKSTLFPHDISDHAKVARINSFIYLVFFMRTVLPDPSFPPHPRRLPPTQALADRAGNPGSRMVRATTTAATVAAIRNGKASPKVPHRFLHEEPPAHADLGNRFERLDISM